MKEKILKDLKARIRSYVGLVVLGIIAWLMCSAVSAFNFWHHRLVGGVLVMALAAVNLALLLFNGRKLCVWREVLEIFESETEDAE